MSVDPKNSARTINLIELAIEHRPWLMGLWLMVVGEAALTLLFPLVIGIAIDDLLDDSLRGLAWLGAIASATVCVGALRRFCDTRVYSKIYAQVSERIVVQERFRRTDVSTTTARTHMASEFVEFLENSFPEIINSLITLMGTLLMIYFLQTNSLVACLAATAVIGAIYFVTSRHTLHLNEHANDESERRVDVIKRSDSGEVSHHFQSVIRWKIRLSDLETVTFSASWIILIAVLLYSVWAAVDSGVTTHGKVLAILMYVFNYVESVIVLPMYYQQTVRLSEIATRIKG